MTSVAPKGARGGRNTIVTHLPDGTDVHARVNGRGPVLLVLHAARDDGSAWGRVADQLSDRFRVMRVQRRQHRLDVDGPCSIRDEVADVRTIAAGTRAPIVLVGHSSGAVVALEAMVASPARFAGAVLYEPPVITGPLLGGDALARAQNAYLAGKPGRALAYFLRDIVRVRRVSARLVGAVTAAVPKRRAYVRPQLDDCAAIDELGERIDTYARIDLPVLLLGGSRSPRHLGERMDVLEQVLPKSKRVILRGQGHHANILAPKAVAAVIDRFAGDLVHTT
jgi:pimeloyl-ACP methyl ester carboxylesterase